MPNDIANNMADTIHQLEEDRIMLSAQLTDLQIAYNEQMLELKEAKRLLKAAVPIINNTFPETGSCWGCVNHDEAKDECKGGAFEECSEVCKWEHADEALKLIES